MKGREIILETILTALPSIILVPSILVVYFTGIFPKTISNILLISIAPIMALNLLVGLARKDGIHWLVRSWFE